LENGGDRQLQERWFVARGLWQWPPGGPPAGYGSDGGQLSPTWTHCLGIKARWCPSRALWLVSLASLSCCIQVRYHGRAVPVPNVS